MSGACEDADEALIDESTLFQIMDTLDIDGDGDVSKDEFMVPWMKLFPKLHRADYEKVWKEIDKDESGTLSLPELAAYYGFNLSPSAKRAGDQTANMTDEQILEALQLSAALQELAEEKAQRQKDKEQEDLDAVAAQLAAAQGGRRGRRASSGAGGSDGLRRGSVGAVQVRQAEPA
jgi:Ca2+-binding EF-hand superfamily protein